MGKNERNSDEFFDSFVKKAIAESMSILDVFKSSNPSLDDTINNLKKSIKSAIWNLSDDIKRNFLLINQESSNVKEKKE